MKISDRIKVICNAVAQGESIADIGTDHAYVPFILYNKNISPQVIMCDISEFSLKKARETFDLAKICLPNDDFRVGNGLSVIKEGEVDNIIIAGLGGATIVEILNSDIKKLRSFKKLILQPRNNSGLLRAFLYKHNIKITSEILVCEGKFICEVIVAETSYTELDSKDLPYGMEDIRWKYTNKMLESDLSLLNKKLIRAINSTQNEIANLKRSSSDYGSRIELLYSNLDYLNEFKGKIDG